MLVKDIVSVPTPPIIVSSALTSMVVPDDPIIITSFGNGLPPLSKPLNISRPLTTIVDPRDVNKTTFVAPPPTNVARFETTIVYPLVPSISTAPVPVAGPLTYV
jgi:hypothetical protein